ncbi:hypothetical protein EIP91_005107 [Steccherinum ochraceum]|uniref:DUF6589 domain-containing protein n=1 Tax=Steccherinum ochraceum TaxID=92696 RepID=A0A4R0R846_9APHY|nr:hypothetical protein EIP91_005107 [Steccherinum ochraceum]
MSRSSDMNSNSDDNDDSASVITSSSSCSQGSANQGPDEDTVDSDDESENSVNTQSEHSEESAEDAHSMTDAYHNEVLGSPLHLMIPSTTATTPSLISPHSASYSPHLWSPTYPPPPAPAYPTPGWSFSHTLPFSPCHETSFSDICRSHDVDPAWVEFGKVTMADLPGISAFIPDSGAWLGATSRSARVLVVLRCARQMGFESLGELFSVVLADDYAEYPEIYQSVSAFLRGRGLKGQQPADIVQKMFTHRKSKPMPGGSSFPPLSLLPRYAQPNSMRFAPTSESEATCTSSQAALTLWAINRVVDEVNTEADRLVNLFSTYDALRWDTVTNWSMSDLQDTIVKQAPCLHTVVTAVAVSKRTKAKLAAHAVAASTCSSEDSDPEDIPDRSPSPSNMSISSSESGSQHRDIHLSVSAALEVPPAPTVSDTAPDSSNCASPSPEPQETSTEAEVVDDANLLNITRDPWIVVTVLIWIMVYSRNMSASFFQTILSLVLFICRAPRQVFDILCRMGLCVSYPTTLVKLRQLGKDSRERVRAYGSQAQRGYIRFLLVFDNINKMIRATDKSLGRKDAIHNGTAATLVALEDVPDGALNMAPLRANIAAQTRRTLTVEELANDIDWKHITRVGEAHILMAWTTFVPELKVHASAVRELFTEDLRRRQLRLRKSVIEPLQCSDIDEASTAGVGEVIDDLLTNQLGIPPGTLGDNAVIFCGDQASVAHLRKLIMYRDKGETPAERLDNVIDRIELWHMKFALLKSIFRTNWCSLTAKGTYGVAHDLALLGREKFNHIKCDYYQGHENVQDIFTATCLEALRLQCVEATGITAPAGLLTDNLSQYFATNGALNGCSFDRLRSFARVVYQRYMSIRACDDCEDYRHWDPAVYGPAMREPLARPAPTSDAPPSPAHVDQSEPTIDGDRVLANRVNFMRLTLWYLEMCHAAAQGDVGRVFEIVKLLRFSFWGAGCSNYGNELLELACRFIKEFPPEMRDAFLDNYLVNPSGLAGHWIAYDLLQEHFNFWIKLLFNSKGMTFDSTFLKECVSQNLGGFGDLRNRFRSWLGLAKRTSHHTMPKKVADINRLGDHYRRDSILTFHRGRSQPYTVCNEFAIGIDKLENEQLQIFLDRTSPSSATTIPTSSQQDATEVREHSLDSAPLDEADLDGPHLPACPLHLVDGLAVMHSSFDTLGLDPSSDSSSSTNGGCF